MLPLAITAATAFVVAFSTVAEAQPASTHVRVASLSSSMDGTFQWIELEVVRVGTTPLALQGRKVTVADRHGGVRGFAFTGNVDGLDPPSALRVYSIAGIDAVQGFLCDTEGWCDYSSMTVPGYLLPIDGGTIAIEGMDELVFGPLPVQGCTYRLRDGRDVGWDTEWYGPCQQRVLAREFHHAGLDHYFTTARVDEMLALARGATPGWSLTGKAHWYQLGPAFEAIHPVCRILLLDPVRYSHFLSASPSECASVAAGGDAVLESSAVVHVAFPIDGACKGRYTHPSGAWKPIDLGVPVYRLWNGKVPPNHRYATDHVERDAMIARGWVLEGVAPHNIAWCSPEGDVPPAPTP